MTDVKTPTLSSVNSKKSSQSCQRFVILFGNTIESVIPAHAGIQFAEYFYGFLFPTGMTQRMPYETLEAKILFPALVNEKQSFPDEYSAACSFDG